jgi:hypothetical protein
LLSHGTSGGDENLPVRASAIFWTEGWSSLWRSSEAPWLMHRFLWFVEKAVWQGVLEIFVPGVLARNSLVADALMVWDDVLFMLAATGVMMWHLLRCGYKWPFASLASAALLFASSAVSLFSGGVLECQMTFYAVVIAAMVDGEALPDTLRWIVLLTASALLVFSKDYALATLLPLSLLFNRPRERWLYAISLVTFAATWALLLRITAGNGIEDLYENMIAGPTMQGVLVNFGEAVFSFSFGAVWCFPLLAFAFVDRGSRRSALLKLSGFTVLIAFLALFDFWHGSGAVAGPRYILPFVMLFFPEVASGFAVAVRRWRWVCFAVPALALLFLPSIDYHNSQAYSWTNVPHSDTGWPHSDPAMQPGVLGWRVVLAKTYGEEKFRPGRGMPVAHTAAIFPMTGISRFLYLLEGRAADSRQPFAQNWLRRHGVGNTAIWITLRDALAGALLLWLFYAAAKVALLAATPERRAL